MKKLFTEPKIIISFFKEENIITASGYEGKRYEGDMSSFNTGGATATVSWNAFQENAN